MKKLSYSVIIVGAVAILLYFLADSFSPGSYGDAKTYSLDIAEEDLIRLLSDFKSENPRYQVRERLGLEDHRSNHWYVIYFYYPDEDEIIYTWTRPSAKNKS